MLRFAEDNVLFFQWEIHSLGNLCFFAAPWAGPMLLFTWLVTMQYSSVIWLHGHTCVLSDLMPFSFLGVSIWTGIAFLGDACLLKLNKHQWVLPPLVVFSVFFVQQSLFYSCVSFTVSSFVTQRQLRHEHVFRFIGIQLVFRRKSAAYGFHGWFRGKIDLVGGFEHEFYFYISWE